MRELKKSASLRFLSILGSLSAHTGLQFYFSETAGVNASYSTSTRGGGEGLIILMSSKRKSIDN